MKKSIRNRITVILLAGFAVLWVAVGAGIYLSLRQSLLKEIDTDLAVDARIVRFAARGDDDDSSPRRGGRRLSDRMPGYDQTGSGNYYQIWSEDGSVAEKSKSLGDEELPFPGPVENEPIFQTQKLKSGETIRTMAFQSGPGPRGKGKSKAQRAEGTKVTMLARDTVSTNKRLASVLGAMALVGLGAAVVAVALIGAALSYGLKPLRDLARLTDDINSETLDARFDASRSPAELRPVCDKLNDLIRRLEESFERERRFSSDLAHEMRTPVAELRMLSEVALKWPEESGPGVHEETREIAIQLETMIENLLSLARWESGELSLEKKAIDLASFSEECWRPFSSFAEKKRIEIRFDFSQTAKGFETDPSMFEHILANLFSNAVHHAPDGSYITVTGLENGVGVSNPAPGLREEDVDRLFDRYWQADRSRTDSSHAGLGLSLARSCASALGLQLSASLVGGTIHFLVEIHDA